MKTFVASRNFGLRRSLFFLAVGLTTLFALALLTSVYQKDGLSFLELLLLLLYAVLFSWICFSFWTALTGFVVSLLQRDRYCISASKGNPSSAAPPRTALAMPIHNEDPRRVFAGVRAICESLIATGQQGQFDFFVLSDTRDPEIWVEEELYWHQMAGELRGKIRLHYRNRSKNTERKVGNLKEFCTRWGRRYRYMIVLDADSLMEGKTLLEMTRLMEVNPRVGLLQVPPVPVNRESLFARIQQFASRVYGPIFTAGLNFWQLSEGNYWGHNAIVRTEAFANHCGLPRLPGKEPFGGEILSHDFVEAAFLRRAGWEVWLAYDLNGSYEEIPPTLIDYAKRDRRWCQGNLQHAGLLPARDLLPMSRLHLIMGIMSYLASPLWLLFLFVTGAEAYARSQTELVYFFGYALFPVWPETYTVEMTTVLIVTLTFLFLPKILSLFLLLGSEAKRYGGRWRLSVSVLLETLLSMLLAPILMLFQSKFVVAILLRRNISWAQQQRDDHATQFREALFTHFGHTVLGIAAGIATYHYINDFFWWFIPVLLGMALSIPLSMLLSRVDLGQRARRRGLFLTPEETAPPQVLQTLHSCLTHSCEVLPADNGRFLQALVEPKIHALHAALLPPSTASRRHKHYLEGLIIQLLEEGAASLSAAERRALLADREVFEKLHRLIWSLPAMDASLGQMAESA